MLFKDHHGAKFVFANEPFTNIKKAFGNEQVNCLFKHENSLEHKNSVAACVNFRNSMSKPAECIANISKKLSEEETLKYVKGIRLVFRSLA